MIAIILSLVVWYLQAFPHDFHASLTEVKQNNAEKVYEISLRVFTDDLETALSQDLGVKYRIKPDTEIDPQISSYLQKKWVMKMDGQDQKPIYLGKEFDQDVCYLFFEYTYIKEPVTIQITNEVFMELFEDQTNLINVYRHDRRKTVVFDQGKRSALFD